MKTKKLHQKTARNAINLREIFANRTSPFLGLTKIELLSVFYDVPISDVLSWKPSKMETNWDYIKQIKKYLVRARIIAIISKIMPRGTTLRDSDLGSRTLDKTTYVFFKCSTSQDAINARDVLDKIGKGFYITGNSIVSTIREEKQEKPVFEKLKKVKN